MIDQNKNVNPPQKGEIIPLEIHAIGNSGEGVGYYQGYTVFVDGALPSEKVRVRLEECKKNYGRGKLVEVITPSSSRIEPICPLFESCGGCQLMHLAYEAQLKIKQQKVIDALQRIGKLKDITVKPCFPSPNQMGYRNKIQLPAKNIGQKLALGLYAKGSHALIEVDNCFIHCKIGQEVYQEVKRLLKESGLKAFDEESRTGDLRHILIKSSVNLQEVLVILVTNNQKSAFLHPLAKKILALSPLIKGVIHNPNPKGGNVILGERYECLAGQDKIREKLGDLTFEISAASFFQVNSGQAENVYKKALELASLEGTETLLDAYCGVGTLSLFFAGQAKKVIGVECVEEAIKNAKENAALNHIKNAHFFCDKAEHFIKTIEKVEVVLLNPPRKGCEESLLRSLKNLQPDKILYISCDPATLARDLAYLQAAGYSIKEVQPFDMFPQTSHVETVVKLEKGNAA